MKNSNTKRVLAFWLAVAMLAAGSPVALAEESDVMAIAPLPSVNMQSANQKITSKKEQFVDTILHTTRQTQRKNGITPNLVTLPRIETAKPTGYGQGGDTDVPTQKTTLTVNGSTIYKTYDGTTQVPYEAITVSFAQVKPDEFIKGKDYTVTGTVASPNAGITTGSITITLTASAAQKYQFEGGKTSYTVSNVNATITKATPKIHIPKVSLQKGADENTARQKIKDGLSATGVNGSPLQGEWTELTLESHQEFSTFAVDWNPNQTGVYTFQTSFIPKDTQNYESVVNIKVTCDLTGSNPQNIVFAQPSMTKTFGEPNFTNPLDGPPVGKVTYESSNPKVATVSAQGEVTIVGAGTTTITATAQGDDNTAFAQASYTLTVSPKDMSTATIQDIPDQAYTGKEVKPIIALTGADGLKENVDYTVSYQNNIQVGTATATVTFQGNYSGTIRKNFQITKMAYPGQTSFTISARPGQTVYGTIPQELISAQTVYDIGTPQDPNGILNGKPTITKGNGSIQFVIQPTATANQSATVEVMASSPNHAQTKLTYTITVNSKTDVSSKITFNNSTVTADGTAKSLQNPTISGITAGTNPKWTYAISGISTYTTASNAQMPTFTQPGVYTVTATYEDDLNWGSKSAILTITSKAAKSNIKLSSATRTSSSVDDNYRYFSVYKSNESDGYARIYAEGDEDLVKQRKNGTDGYWIALDLYMTVNGTSPAEILYISSNGTNWSQISSGSIGNYFYLDEIQTNGHIRIWFDTDGDRDLNRSFYLATDAKGSNKFEVNVSFDSYYNNTSSSGSSSSSSSDTSKVDGKRVSTTTIDRTPSVKNGSATTSFTYSSLADALEKNQREAKREDADKTLIELDVKTSRSVADTRITIPRSALDDIADEKTGLQLVTNHGTFTFDSSALAAIYKNSSRTSLDFYFEQDTDEYIVKIRDGSSDIIDLGSGNVEMKLSYKLKSGENAANVKVYRIGDGRNTWMARTNTDVVYGSNVLYAAANYVTNIKADYSASKKEVTFNTNALGTFLVTTNTLTTGGETKPINPSYSPFIDVPSSRWSATYINKLASLGIINGTGGGYFEPNLYVTREEFVKMLAGVAKANTSGYYTSRFPDVPSTRWSAPYVAWAASHGITAGTDGGKFAPTMHITRQEMATMIYRYVQSAGKTLPLQNTQIAFADANKIDSWAQVPVSVMQQAGIISGNVTNGRYTFDPMIPATREECAKMLAVLYDLL